MTKPEITRRAILEKLWESPRDVHVSYVAGDQVVPWDEAQTMPYSALETISLSINKRPVEVHLEGGTVVYTWKKGTSAAEAKFPATEKLTVAHAIARIHAAVMAERGTVLSYREGGAHSLFIAMHSIQPPIHVINARHLRYFEVGRYPSSAFTELAVTSFGRDLVARSLDKKNSYEYEWTGKNGTAPSGTVAGTDLQHLIGTAYFTLKNHEGFKIRQEDQELFKKARS